MLLLNRGNLKRFLLFFIVLIGAGLRLYKWNSYSLWYDESLWMFTDADNLLRSFILTVGLFKPPLFRILLYFWSFLGLHEFVLRLLPSIIGTVSIFLTYKVGKTIFDEKIGLFASFFVSISPFHIYYSQELSHYGLTMLLALCSVYYMVMSLNRNNIFFWMKFSLFTTLTIYTGYPAVFLIVAENIFFLSSYHRYKSSAKRWFLSQLAIIVLYLPWLVVFRYQFLTLSLFQNYHEWIPRGSLIHIFQAIRLFSAGYNATFIIHLFALLLFVPLVASGVFHNVKKNGQKIKLMLIWFFTPFILSILCSGIQPSFTYRNFIFVLPAYYFLAALGMASLKRYFYAPLFLFIIVIGLSLSNYYMDIFPYPEDFYRPGVHAKKDNRAVTTFIAHNLQEGDIIMHTCRSTFFPYMYYLFTFSHRGLKGARDFLYRSFNIPVCEVGMEELLHKALRWGSALTVKNTEEALRFITPATKRIWLVFSSWEPHLLISDLSSEENKVKQWLDTNFVPAYHKTFTGIEVYLYETSIYHEEAVVRSSMVE